MTEEITLTQPESTQESSPLTIVVGTGRCGSTMLSNLLWEHPDVLSLSEFFILVEGQQLHKEVLDGAQFWTRLSTPRAEMTALLRQGLRFPELLYPVSSTSRYTAETGVPSILLVTLPHLTDDYEAVFDELQQVVGHFPTDSIERHYIRLFEWFKQRFGHRVCIERSGASLPLVPSLAQGFPDAKFVHLVRDGRECAMSMSRHHGFRLMAASRLEAQRYKAEGIQPDTYELQQRVFAKINDAIPIEIFGRLWTNMLLEGIRYLSQMPEERVMTITYEQLLNQPESVLTQLMTFIDPSLIDEQWLRTVATRVRPQSFTWKQLPTQERESLEVACQPGLTALEVVWQEGLHSAKLANLLDQAIGERA